MPAKAVADLVVEFLGARDLDRVFRLQSGMVELFATPAAAV